MQGARLTGRSQANAANSTLATTSVGGKKTLRSLSPKELLDQFVQGPMTAEANQDVSMAFKSALIERALGGELSHHSALRYRGWSSTTRTSLSAWGGHRVRG